jgi:tRNA(Arg) A34 adenosine deaminase TadA
MLAHDDRSVGGTGSGVAACFELAWESFQVGSSAVGAVLVDGARAIVSAGRNRRNERPEVPGLAAATQPTPRSTRWRCCRSPITDHVYTTLEPCLLCTAVPD